MKPKSKHSSGSTQAHRIDSPMCARLLTIRKASEYTGLPVWSIRTLLWNGRLPFIRIGHTQYIDRQDLDAFIDREKVSNLM